MAVVKRRGTAWFCVKMDELADWMRVVGGKKRSTRTEFSLRDWQTKQRKQNIFGLRGAKTKP